MALTAARLNKYIESIISALIRQVLSMNTKRENKVVEIGGRLSHLASLL